MSDSRQRRITRLVGAIAGAGPARIEPTRSAARVLLRLTDGRALACDTEMVTEMVRAGWLDRAPGGECGSSVVVVTEDGRSFLNRMKADGDHAGQHRDLRRVPGAPALVNAAESPLARLARTRHGQALIDEDLCAAGERLRADFEFGQLRQKVTASWDPAHTVRAGAASAAGAADLGDRALDARARLHAALEAVGPEFAGVLIDVCCFLKGLEQVETERGWPRRSAKVMLAAALRALDRHYNPPPAPRRSGTRHWGSADYRPDAMRP
ncbi:MULTISPECIES: DUF6456 domain-containing protein [unclassified Roseitalea]|uniref:DUF6456 domain-containing protein n=1 Tax=unclassified Roseitalea TaxID=2639107 RepID=UPI00273E2FB0|nr:MULTISPECIES: DUF6456 domain-containing protein [unclassified Roseitalea]